MPIPIHFISTAGVAHFNKTGALLPQSLKDTPPPAIQDTTTATGLGYISSKWASEVYLESCASTFSLPVTIHRPASIVGQDVPATDLVHTILDLSVKTSSLPSLNGADMLNKPRMIASHCRSPGVSGSSGLVGSSALGAGQSRPGNLAPPFLSRTRGRLSRPAECRMLSVDTIKCRMPRPKCGRRTVQGQMRHVYGRAHKGIGSCMAISPPVDMF
ncbi:hypothetical protein ASPVEDRAFT_32609 [Aspergillus versicolor CBS 583.65]|uniref:Thioester reductase (TE) domain-containing protein n=1 Tax=Aspergillus versicolor CBS 583.65 TaxID=1036611 RepID=A0A1L9PXN4_ASPVE|nr:uncharacterized protein ASPVEDRAFT_32609 [Aspergillus versicolor CBS 583.65]OJJ06301.1 hypothetical protein ASPVEDRAFT_32609 [Aspergillus versicolor CBS 583.65]